MVTVALAVRLSVYIWAGFWHFSRRHLAEKPMNLFNIPFLAALTILALPLSCSRSRAI